MSAVEPNKKRPGKSGTKATKKLAATQGKPKEYEIGHGKPPVRSRWKKGQSGNPAGPKPGFRTLSDAARGLLERRINKKRDAPTFAEAIVAEIARLALRKGNVSAAGKVGAATFVRDTAEGKPPQRIDMGGSLQITKERERQVRFLIHTVKQTQQQIGGDVAVEQIWTVVEGRERELFGEDVSELKEAVLGALVGTKQLEDGE